VDEPTTPEVPEGMRLRDPASWLYLPREVRRAWLGYALAGGMFVTGFPVTFLLEVAALRWLGVVAIVVGAAGVVAIGIYVLRWWGDERRLVRSSARRIVVLGVVLLVGTLLGYWFFVIPSL
jgi:hypothetical protein